VGAGPGAYSCVIVGSYGDLLWADTSQLIGVQLDTWHISGMNEGRRPSLITTRPAVSPASGYVCAADEASTESAYCRGTGKERNRHAGQRCPVSA
jgi:hypothetical protein